MVPDLWDPYNYKSASTKLPSHGHDIGQHLASDPMILEAALLYYPMIAEVEVDSVEVTPN